nr:hypothetical protein CPGR_05339 [Mycolicibacter nonchromogenicus]
MSGPGITNTRTQAPNMTPGIVPMSMVAVNALCRVAWLR